MEFDPSFPEKIPFLSGIFPDIKAEIPMSKENTTFCMYQNNFNHFQHLLNEPNHDNHPANFFPEGSSSIITSLFTLSSSTPSSGDSSSSFKTTYTIESLKGGFANPYFPMPYAPNNTQDEPMHGYPNYPNKAIWDFSQKIPIPSGAGASASSQLQLQKKSDGKIQHKMANIIKGQWSPEEDRALVQLVKRFGLKKWSHVAKLLNGRVGKQCRERWHNHLRPNIRKESWNEEEDKILIEAHQEVGNKWAEIARRMPGRTENTIKNHWNATKRRQNAKKQRSKRKNSKGNTLLENYIRHVTAAEEAEKELKNSMVKMNLKGESSICTTKVGGPFRVGYEISEGDFSSDQDWSPHGAEHEVGFSLQQQQHLPHGGGYVPVMVSAGMEDMIMRYEVAMEMTPENQKKEMDLMEMIFRKA